MISPVKVWRRQKHITQLLGQKGKVVSWTIIRTPPVGFKHSAPYAIVIAETDRKKRILAQYVGNLENLKKGLLVTATVRKLRDNDPEDVIPYGLAFEAVCNR